MSKYNRKKHTAYMKAYYKRNPDKKIANTTYLRKVRAERKRLLVEMAGGRCVDCGYNAHLAALEFDHIAPNTKYLAVATLMHYKWETAVNEMLKCELVCSNCHAIRTHNRRKG